MAHVTPTKTRLEQAIELINQLTRNEIQQLARRVPTLQFRDIPTQQQKLGETLYTQLGIDREKMKQDDSAPFIGGYTFDAYCALPNAQQAQIWAESERAEQEKIMMTLKDNYPDEFVAG